MRCECCEAKLKPVIALDIDGTLADYHGHFVEFACKWMDVDLQRYQMYSGVTDLATYLGISKEQYRTIKLAYRQGGQKRWQPPLFPNPGMLVDRLIGLGFEVWIATTRPYNRFDSTDPDTRWWLDKHGVRFDGLIYDDDKMSVLVDRVGRQRISMVVDDLSVNLEHAATLEVPAYQILTRYNAGARWHGPSVEGYQDIINIAQEIQELDENGSIGVAERTIHSGRTTVA